MSGSFYSPSWYRVANLKPRLHGHVQISRHHYRGERWYVLRNRSSGRHHRLNPEAYYFIGLMDGRRSVQEIWDAANSRFGDDAATQDETILLLAQLHGADMIQTDVTPDTGELFERHQRQQRSRWKQRLWNPLALRVPLFDPDRFLDRWQGLVRPLFSRPAAMVWLLLVLSAVFLAGVHWQELMHDLADRALDPKNLLLIALIYPLIKVLHELGHAFATKIWGGEVHEMGITLLVFMPIPYVDASAASSFPDRRRRMIVGAAGILVELFLAALALLLWLNLEPGLVRNIAFNVALIGGVSTLLFNGNPLLRFDGYYVLADAIEIPNLGSRSSRYFGYLLQHRLFGVEEMTSPANTRSERCWFLIYGLASLLYRLVILGVIVLFVGGKFFFVGVLLAALVVATQVIVPLGKHLKFLFHSPLLRRRRGRALIASGLILGLTGGLTFALPVPSWTSAQGVVWLPERSQLRTATDCFVDRFLVPPGARVDRGQPLMRCSDPLLDASVRVKQAQLDELRARLQAEGLDDRVRAEILGEEIAAVEADLAHARERRNKLIVHSAHDGILVVPVAEDLPGRYLEQGTLVGYVMEQGRELVRVVVTQAQIGLVRKRTLAVEARLASRFTPPLAGWIQREVPAASERLPSAALGTTGGGPYVVDPKDPSGTRSRQKLFQFDIALPEKLRLSNKGERVYVRFFHGSEPLGLQWYRSLRQLFLSRFNV